MKTLATSRLKKSAGPPRTEGAGAPSTTARVDLTAFRHNLNEIRRNLSPGTRMLLVVKSNAYGHGMTQIARAAQQHPAVAYFGVATADEALELRAAKIQKPILILAPVHPARLKKLIDLNITFSISSTEEARRLNHAAEACGKPVKVHVEIDTGMGRLGVDYPRALDFLFALRRLGHLELEGAFTHFASADRASSSMTIRQLKIFSMVIDLFRELYNGSGILRFAHAANSAGAFRFDASHFNLVRPGLAAYGVCPFRGPQAAKLRLKPVLSLRTHIAHLRTVEANTPVSYHSTYRTRRRSTLAVLPVGYSSGYPLRLSNRSRALIGGKSFKIAGRITMDQIMLDLGSWRGARLWDEVVLLGASGSRQVTAGELARLAETIPYEILCGIHPKIPRTYVV